ncbi:bifunctional phosphoribosyl-AMP cyclohydrolase/phosphoribosyl-ATP diphosphatase HisIE [Mahella australiensis]|uniref:Histidine biosynthesis bifunctional protein HisIE n=1 Tax=Mahella australiensis (strain DSM 15567 / CIP 107919 / 50-1 BON) TaxID=697281 RepID=F3ZX38_MAHA5|nr:bifunctional phosphoribosyl-AMP cyclohydrolase/phosphoribosyl-ATP diphosphatase HisIE [Mahella australiensis]AEE95487.1 phosphoribosyl-AMP cyclohydrolase; phosphoribosyl-ATP pyrophosphatase [Mahella australiensis 50-1 BON]
MDDFISKLKFDDKGLIPAIIQDYTNGQVLMLAYMNKQSLRKTMETGQTYFYSRSRDELWHKGETSGHFQNVKGMSYDCDGDALLIKVEQMGAACHTGHRSCFFNTVVEQPDIAKGDVLAELYDVIVDRKNNPKEGSYTDYLFEKGIDKILKKVGEESAEVIIAAKNGVYDEVRWEVADLFYHVLVLLVQQGMTLDDIYAELKGRRH